MKRILLFAILAFFSISTLHAQTAVSGKVVDESTNNPLSGATISVGGKSVATTDKDGQFSFSCSKSTSIAVTFVGYQTHKQIVNCGDQVSISLSLSSNTLDNVEITATTIQNKSLLYQPTSITKLNQTELKRGTGLFLDDAINGNVPGVTMQRRAVSSGQQFNIRGYGNGSGGTGRINSNFDGQGYKVYLNGIPVTDAEGITLMDDIDFGSIGNVEVIKGPSGTLYGLAAAGVVNLNTYKPESGKISVGQDVLVGTYDLQRYTTHFEMGGERSSLLLNYGHQTTQGYTIHNNSKKDFVNAAGEFRPNDKQTVGFYFGYSKSYDERNGELTLSQYLADDFTGNIEYIKRNGHSAITGFRAGVRHTYAFCKNFSNTTTIFGSSVSNNASSAAGWTDKDPLNYGFRTTFDASFKLPPGSTLSGIVGMEGQRQNAQTVGYTMVKDPRDPNATWVYGNPYYWIVGASTSNKYTTSSTSSYFTEWTLALPHDFSITAGVGLSTMGIDLTDRFYVANSYKTRFDTTYKGMVSPHFALNKVFNKNVSVYFSYSKGYKAPTSSYFYVPTTGTVNSGFINSGLKPEIGNQFEIGTKGTLANHRLVYQLALFDAIFSNKMTAINVLNAAGTATQYTYVANGGKQDDKGIEALVKYSAYQSDKSFIAEVRPFVNFTVSDFKYKDYTFHYKGKVLIDSAVNFDGKSVVGVGKFNINAGVDEFTKPGVYLNVIWTHRDKFAITSDNLNMTSAYDLLNAKLGYKGDISAHFSIDAYFGVNNIGGVKYPIAVFVNQLPDAYLSGPRKANCFAGLGIRYNIK